MSRQSVIVILALVGAVPVLADDVMPAPFRGTGLSTAAQWQFLSDQGATAIQPDGSEVGLLKGSAAAALDAAFPPGADHPSAQAFGDAVWTGNVSDGGFRGGSAGTGVLAFNVPAWISTPESRTWVRLQIIWSGVRPTTAVFGLVGVPGTTNGVSEVKVAETVDLDPGLPAGTSVAAEDWRITPDVDWFQVAVFLPQGAFLDGVIIESIDSSVEWSSGIFSDGLESGDTSAWSLTVP